MTIDAGIGGGPWGPSYRVHSEGDSVVWSAIEGGQERQEVIDPGPDGWARFWRAVEEADAWHWQQRYDDHAVVDGTSWSVRLERDGQAVAASGSNATPSGWATLQQALEQLAGGRSWC